MFFRARGRGVFDAVLHIGRNIARRGGRAVPNRIQATLVAPTVVRVIARLTRPRTAGAQKQRASGGEHQKRLRILFYLGHQPVVFGDRINPPELGHVRCSLAARKSALTWLSVRDGETDARLQPAAYAMIPTAAAAPPTARHARCTGMPCLTRAKIAASASARRATSANMAAMTMLPTFQTTASRFDANSARAN